MSMLRRLTGLGLIGWITLALLASYTIFPLGVFCFNALKTPMEISASPLSPPATPRWSNYTQAFTEATMGRGLLNSLIISLGTAVGVAFIASMAAYALVRLRVRGRGIWVLWLLASTSLPIQMFIVPLLSWWSLLGLYNTRIGIVIIYWALYSPFATLLIRSFLLTIPPDFEEAARLDGAGEFRLFTKVVVPMIWPGVATAALIAGVQAYNEFMLAVTFIQDATMMPATLSLYVFQQNYSPNWALVSAAGALMAIPAVVTFVLLQDQFTRGYAHGGLAN